MFLTPKDIHDKTFKRSFKGYDENEVDEFLDLVIKEFNLMIDENERLRQELTAKPIVQEYSATSVNEIKHLEALLAQAIENMNKNAEIVMARGLAVESRPKEEPDRAQEKNKLDEFKKTLETYKSSFDTLIEDQRRQINQKYNEILANYTEPEAAAQKSAPLFYAPETPAQPQPAEQPAAPQTPAQAPQQAPSFFNPASFVTQPSAFANPVSGNAQPAAAYQPPQSAQTPAAQPQPMQQQPSFMRQQPPAQPQAPYQQPAAQQQPLFVPKPVQSTESAAEPPFYYGGMDEQPGASAFSIERSKDVSQRPVGFAPRYESKEDEGSAFLRQQQPVIQPKFQSPAQATPDFYDQSATAQDNRFKPNYSEYAWLYQDKDAMNKTATESSANMDVSFRNPREKEELKRLIDEVID